MSFPKGDSRLDPPPDYPCIPWYTPDEMVRAILSTVPPEQAYRVVVVGCGSKDPSRRLAEETGAEVLNLDVHPPDPCLPFAGDWVDQVWCLGAMTHVEDLARFTEEVTRVLHSGGRALVADTFWDGFRPPRFADHAGRPWYAVATKSVVSLLARTGLTEAAVLPWPSPAQPEARNGAGKALAEDLADGRLRPALVLARKP